MMIQASGPEGGGYGAQNGIYFVTNFNNRIKTFKYKLEFIRVKSIANQSIVKGSGSGRSRAERKAIRSI